MREAEEAMLLSAAGYFSLPPLFLFLPFPFCCFRKLLTSFDLSFQPVHLQQLLCRWSIAWSLQIQSTGRR
jgi:hypothetical protein